MPKYPPELFLINILVSIDKIKRNTEKLSFLEFVESETIFGFTIRELQEIGESGKKLLASIEPENSDIEWRKIIAFRNIVVHRYFGIEPTVVSEVITKEIPILEKEIISLLKNTADRNKLSRVMRAAKKTYTKFNRENTVAYLEEVEKLIEL